MTRRIVALTPDRVATLPGPCASCAAWEATPAQASALREDRAGRIALKSAWVEQVSSDWGPCGWLVLVDDAPVGYAVYAPPALVPGADRFPTAPVSPDAVLLTEVHVLSAHAGGGLGRLLVQRVARDLHQRAGYRALEAFATPSSLTSTNSRRGVEPEEDERCVPPVGFLAEVGFATQREHPRCPRMRMDLRAALTWREEMEAVLRRIRGAVSSAPAGQRQPGPARSVRRTESITR